MFIRGNFSLPNILKHLWQLRGDFVKGLSIVMAYPFLAKKNVLALFDYRGLFVVMLYLTSIYFTDLYWVKGVLIGHFVCCVLYFGVILLILGSSLFVVDTVKE